ncbi:MAG: hypothetical protein WAW17_19580 [Rhodococcus sp. (in: high G+C Gram-positive bacteria)]|uniref:hypothetical protein n=1 Tax=Rhodococcus sp. TaxID=1831 RepID=UPI003BB1D744
MNIDRDPVHKVTTTNGSNGAGDVAVMLGALSVVAFWTFGLGVLLGVGAVVAGTVARARVAKADEPVPIEAVIGAVAGVAGIAAGLMFLAAALPHM